METKGFCPNCEKESLLSQDERTETLEVRGEQVSVPVRIYVCKECKIDFYDPDIDPNELAFREFRRRHNWTQPEDITAIRKEYGFTQSEFAGLLGWGVATLSRYENGALQGESHEKVLKLLRQDPLNILWLLKNNSTISDGRRQDLVWSLTPRKGEFISRLFANVFPKQDEDEFSGFRRFDLSRLRALILYFCKGGCLKTSLNKLLFYSDFKAVKEWNRSITGARYVRINYGPVVNDFNYYFASLVEDGSLELEEVCYPNGYVGEKYSAGLEADLSGFEQKEKDLLAYVKRKLGGLNAGDIADLSHQETAHRNTEEKQAISYRFAKELSI